MRLNRLKIKGGGFFFPKAQTILTKSQVTKASTVSLVFIISSEILPLNLSVISCTQGDQPKLFITC